MDVCEKYVNKTTIVNHILHYLINLVHVGEPC